MHIRPRTICLAAALLTCSGSAGADALSDWLASTPVAAHVRNKILIAVPVPCVVPQSVAPSVVTHLPAPTHEPEPPLGTNTLPAFGFSPSIDTSDKGFRCFEDGPYVWSGGPGSPWYVQRIIAPNLAGSGQPTAFTRVCSETAAQPQNAANGIASPCGMTTGPLGCAKCSPP